MKNIQLSTIIKGLQEGKITIVNDGHLMNSIIDSLEHHLAHNNKCINEYEDKIANGKVMDDDVKCENMIDLYKRNNTCAIGKRIPEIEAYCFNCDQKLFPIIVADNKIILISWREYYDLNKTNNYKYEFTEKESCSCGAKALIENKKLVSYIDFPTGHLVFANYFKTANDTPKGEEYSDPSLNSLIGRNKRMLYLAEQGFGFGQMGNMSVSIFVNPKGDIIIGDEIAMVEETICDKEAYLNGEYGKPPKEEDIKRCQKEIADGKAYMKIIEEGQYKYIDDISLSVWRWMCADKKTLKALKEPKFADHMDVVKVKVEPGRYKLEHYYDLIDTTDIENVYLYSRLTKEK